MITSIMRNKKEHFKHINTEEIMKRAKRLKKDADKELVLEVYNYEVRKKVPLSALGFDKEHIKKVEGILKKGANVNLLEGFPLCCAIMADDIGFCDFLIRNGSDPRISNRLSLRLATENGNKDIIKLLQLAIMTLEVTGYVNPYL